MSRVDDIENELNAVKYWLRLLFVMHGITSEQVSRHIAGLKDQDPESEQTIETVGLEIIEYLQRFERSEAKRRSQKPKHPPKK